MGVTERSCPERIENIVDTPWRAGILDAFTSSLISCIQWANGSVLSPVGRLLVRDRESSVPMLVFIFGPSSFSNRYDDCALSLTTLRCDCGRACMQRSIRCPP